MFASGNLAKERKKKKQLKINKHATREIRIQIHARNMKENVWNFEATNQTSAASAWACVCVSFASTTFQSLVYWLRLMNNAHTHPPPSPHIRAPNSCPFSCHAPDESINLTAFVAEHILCVAPSSFTYDFRLILLQKSKIKRLRLASAQHKRIAARNSTTSSYIKLESASQTMMARIAHNYRLQWSRKHKSVSLQWCY